MSKGLIIVLIILAIIVLGVVVFMFLMKRRKNKLINGVNELEIRKNQLDSLPVLAELAKIEEIAKSEQLEEKIRDFKERYHMYSMDFEEFLWAYGYTSEQIEELYQKLIKFEPLDDLTHKTLSEVFKDYIFTGGMPKAVQTFINEKNFFNIFQMQK